MPAIMQNAAAMAYRKAIKKTHESIKEQTDTPEWLKHFGKHMVEDDSAAKPKAINETPRHRKLRVITESKHDYLKFSWFVYDKITSQLWFEAFVLLNIVFVGVVTGLDLEFDKEDGEGHSNRDVHLISFYVSKITLGVFTIECILKIIAEGSQPWQYFIDKTDGYFNTFDFIVVVCSYIFLNDENGQTISFLRMLRLLRLLTFVRDVPQLRIIVAGLTQGMKSVVYIVVLLFLIIYMYSILGCILFGDNDPAHFGTVSISMTSLFQVSTLASWTSIAYISWFGCNNFNESPYGEENPSRIDTMTGSFEGFKCTSNKPEPFLTGLFFASYILLTAWVIMSLFVGVISMGMFESYVKFKEKDSFLTYLNKLDENSMSELECFELGKISLKEKMDMVLVEDFVSKYRPIKWKRKYHKIVNKMKEFRDSNTFSLIITITILIVGVVIGFDMDHSLKCSRLENRINDHNHDEEDDDEHHNYKHNLLHTCKDELLYSFIITIIAQIIFTLEAVVKIIAEGSYPSRYFTDKEDGSWNCLDFFIVIVGFLELTALKSLFANFPIVLLRLLRLVRVMRLAKALPRLRSIVEALISGFSSVGWICLLIFVFNYIVACMFMLIFKDNDPFHFGSIGAAMFTVLRIETLDTWDQILYIAMYGCEGYPNGYELLRTKNKNNDISCDANKAFGWIGAIIMLFVTIVGAYILPTVLIGVVSIKFDETNSYFVEMEAHKKDFNAQLARAREKLPDFFSNDRVDAIEDVFNSLNAGGDTSLDMPEISIFFHYSFEFLFGIELTHENCETLFYLLDSSKTTKIGKGEFLYFILILHEMYESSISNHRNAIKIFGKPIPSKRRRSVLGEKSTWDKAMDRVHQDSYDMTWDSILMSINSEEGDTLKERISKIFSAFDSDGSGEIDVVEMGEGLKSCDIPLNKPQVKYFFSQIKTNTEGRMDIYEFIYHVEKEVEKRMKLKDNQLLHDMKSVLNRTSLMFQPDNDFLTRHCSQRSMVENDQNTKDLKNKIRLLEEHSREVSNVLMKLHHVVPIGAWDEPDSDDDVTRYSHPSTPRPRHSDSFSSDDVNYRSSAQGTNKTDSSDSDDSSSSSDDEDSSGDSDEKFDGKNVSEVLKFDQLTSAVERLVRSQSGLNNNENRSSCDEKNEFESGGREEGGGTRIGEKKQDVFKHFVKKLSEKNILEHNENYQENEQTKIPPSRRILLENSLSSTSTSTPLNQTKEKKSKKLKKNKKSKSKKKKKKNRDKNHVNRSKTPTSEPPSNMSSLVSPVASFEFARSSLEKYETDSDDDDASNYRSNTNPRRNNLRVRTRSGSEVVFLKPKSGSVLSMRSPSSSSSQGHYSTRHQQSPSQSQHSRRSSISPSKAPPQINSSSMMKKNTIAVPKEASETRHSSGIELPDRRYENEEPTDDILFFQFF